jgi:phosphoribosylformylglycinamidine (FGAM) synthase PurS component
MRKYLEFKVEALDNTVTSEEAMDLSYERLHNDFTHTYIYIYIYIIFFLQSTHTRLQSIK